MITAILIAGLAFAGYSVASLKKQNKELKAKLDTTAAAPVEHKPVVRVEVKPDNPTACVKINPTGKIVMRKDVTDIVSLFNYLMMRTDKIDSITDSVNPIAEVDSFIKENMIDLRDQKGLICTDGRYLLQYGKKNSKEKFILVEMKSPKMIQKFYYKYDENVFKDVWDKSAVDFATRIGPETVRKELIGHTDYSLSTFTKADGRKFVTVVSKENGFNVSGDPLFNIRKNTGYDFGQSIHKTIDQIFVSVREEFGIGKGIVAIDSKNNIYTIIHDNTANKNIIIPFDTMKNVLTNIPAYDDRKVFPIVGSLASIIKTIDTNKASIISNKTYSKYSDILGLRFVAIEL